MLFFQDEQLVLLTFFDMTSGFRLGGNPQECPFQCPVFFALSNAIFAIHMVEFRTFLKTSANEISNFKTVAKYLHKVKVQSLQKCCNLLQLKCNIMQ